MARTRRQLASAALPTVAMSARKSAPVSASGVNVRRLMLSRENEEEKEREEEKEPANECGNPFCRHRLANRYARFCEDKAMCQRYRALKLQCLANAQAEEDEEDTRPLSHVLHKRRKRREEKKKEETFAIPRRKKTEKLNTRLGLNEERSNRSSSSRDQEKRERKTQVDEEKREKKRLRRARNTEEAPSTAVNTSPITASSVEEVESVTQRRKKRIHAQNTRARQPPEPSSDTKTRTATGVTGVAGALTMKKRRLNRRSSANDVLSRAALSFSSSAAFDINWKIPRAKPTRPKTAAQTIKNMNLELVPLGVPSLASLAGGGRYVQNGNRSAAQSFTSSDPRSRPPSIAKFTSPAVAAPRTVPASASSRPLRTTQSKMPAPSPSQQQLLPPVPRQVSSLVPPVQRRTGRDLAKPAGTARATTPSSSSMNLSAAVSNANVTPKSTPLPAGTPGIQRISASAYLKSRKSDGRPPQGERLDHRPSRSSSLERSISISDNCASGFPPAPVYPPEPPVEYHRSDSAPSSTYREALPAVDHRRQYPDADKWHQIPHYDVDGFRMEYRERSEGRSEPSSNDRSFLAPWKARNFSPPCDRLPPRQQDVSSFGSSGYDYAPDTHISPASSPAEQPSHRREPSRVQPPPPQRGPSPRRSEVDRVNSNGINSDHDDLDADAPTFSYHETFLPGLLSVFIHKLPKALEAVFNVTKKPRKMNWYVKQVERIERLCKPFDLQIKFEGLKAMVTVRGREWLTLQGSSTVTLHLDIIKNLHAEAVTWLRFYEEMDKALVHYREKHGSQANESYTFFRAWNELKTPGNYISLSRQANYFCGARLHHWNFVIGKVEIGSGSHEEKREALRLATVSALDFLLSIGPGVRRPSRDVRVKSEHTVEAGRQSLRGRHRSSSRESTVNVRARASSANNQVNAASTKPSSSASPPSSSAAEMEPPSLFSTEQSPADGRVTFTKSQTSEALAQPFAEPSSSLVTVELTKMPVVTIKPTSDSISSYEVADTTEHTDTGDEMSISDVDASDQEAVSPRLVTSISDSSSDRSSIAAANSAPPSMASSPATQMAAFTSVISENSSSAASPSTASKPQSTGTTDSTKPKAAIHTSRCMMCEMIRMRKPNGEKCLRCQQKGVSANGALNVSIGP